MKLRSALRTGTNALAPHKHIQSHSLFFRDLNNRTQIDSKPTTDKKPIFAQPNIQSQIVADAFQGMETLLKEKPEMCNWDA
jgi:hypothetical protein